MARLARNLFFRAQHRICPVCGKQLLWSIYKDDPKRMTVEHVWPRATVESYANQTGNILLSHSRCNGEKADREPRGCEVLFLFAVNRRLGYTEAETKEWDQRYAR